MDDALQLFHPQVRLWFRERHGTPTDVQRLAWPAIAGGRHVLATAPTGSGKTLAAFLWALDRLARGAWAPGAVRVLYVSPLRALANDIRRNLTGPLQEIARRFAAAGESLPPIRAALRTGDTPPCQRRRLVTRPPEILITTPESLNLLLSSPGGTRIMTGVATVILDEVHALVGNKRGTHLITAVERLTRLSGEFQRIALSATVRPLETVAEWVGGQVLEEQPGSGPERPGFRRRQVDLVDPAASKAISVSVRMPTGDGACSGADRDAVLADPPTVWERLTQLLVARIRGNRSTLIFGNSRRIVERVARLVNEAAGEQLVFAHHGSLSREVRESVEERLKAGQLAGIVATSSLELGIDVGTVDEVVLVGTPPSISSAIQRVGRSGHGVGEVSRGIFHPYHPRDLLQAAVVSRGLMARDVEPLEPPRAPLDVLAQVILSMVAVERWSLDELFDFVRRSHPYRDLTRRLFDLVVQMLAGRYAGSRVAALASRVAIDQLSGTIEARPGAAQHLWTSGGTIPDRGTFKLRVEGAAGKAALIGELDEEFVWERSEGDSFTLGVQSWRIRRITASDVFVVPARGRPGMTPFWRGEERDQSGWLWERVGALLEEAQRRRDDASLVEELEHGSGLDRASAGALLAFLSRQREASHAPLPHRHHVLMERTTESLTIVHTTWGGRVNRPFAMALVAALRERHGVEAHAFHDDVCVVLEMPEGAPALDLVGLVRPDDLERLLASQLDRTGFFGARFRESAGRALLLPKAGFGRRTPLWLSRQRAKELLAAVGSFDDFPMVLEAWRTCLNDEMELDRLRLLLAELAQGQIRVSEVETTRPTPLAGDVLWKRTNRLMYEDDTPAVGRSRLDRSLISEVALSPGSRPPVPAEQAEILRTKLQRTCPGYAPADAAELQQLVTDRVFVGADEWLELLDAVERDHRLDRTAVLAGVAARVVALPVTGAARPVVCSVEWVGPIVEALGIDPAPALLGAALDGTPATEEALQAAAELDRRRPASERVADLPGLLSEWLRFQGPIAVATVAGLLGLPEEQLLDAVQVGVDEQSLVVGTLTGGERLEVSDTRNLQRLLRAARARARPAFEALGPEKLPLFLALHQGLGGQPLPPGGAEDSVQHALEPLLGFPAPAGCWETHILPARLDPYRTEWLDSVLTHTDLLWFGCGNQRIAFSLLPDLELFAALEDRPGPDALVSADALFPASRGRFSFVELATHSGLDSAALSARLWDLCWRGIVSNDGFDAVRHGLASRFRAALPAGLPSPGSTRSRRIGLGRWRSTRPMTGGWYRLPPPAEPEDPLEGEELSRDRARVLLARWGVVFRELAARELPGLRWAPLFRSLQLLELAGEAVAGRFFEGVGGVQFATPEAVEVLTRGLDEDRVFWVNGVDPASPCGLGIERLKLPKRSESTHLVFHGSRLIVTSEGRGRRLEIQAEPTDPDLTHYLRFLQVLVTREASPVRSIEVETINGQPAGVSRYRPALESLFHVSADSRSLRLTKRY